MEISLGDIIAFIALLLGIYATSKSLKLSSLQAEVMRLEKDLNKILLEKQREETDSSLKADLSATIIKLGHGKERLKIYNKGKGTATNIQFEEIGNSNIPICDDGKFPLEQLESLQSVEIILGSHLQSAKKMKIQLTWDDESNKNRTKELIVTR